MRDRGELEWGSTEYNLSLTTVLPDRESIMKKQEKQK